jgi:hypothetical protein
MGKRNNKSLRKSGGGKQLNASVTKSGGRKKAPRKSNVENSFDISALSLSRVSTPKAGSKRLKKKLLAMAKKSGGGGRLLNASTRASRKRKTLGQNYPSDPPDPGDHVAGPSSGSGSGSSAPPAKRARLPAGNSFRKQSSDLGLLFRNDHHVTQSFGGIGSFPSFEDSVVEVPIGGASGTVGAASGTVAAASGTVAAASGTVAAASGAVAAASGAGAAAPGAGAAAPGAGAAATGAIAAASGTAAFASGTAAAASGAVSGAAGGSAVTCVGSSPSSSVTYASIILIDDSSDSEVEEGELGSNLIDLGEVGSTLLGLGEEMLSLAAPGTVRIIGSNYPKQFYTSSLIMVNLDTQECGTALRVQS